jgi:hypothetical protein
VVLKIDRCRKKITAIVKFRRQPTVEMEVILDAIVFREPAVEPAIVTTRSNKTTVPHCRSSILHVQGSFAVRFVMDPYDPKIR